MCERARGAWARLSACAPTPTGVVPPPMVGNPHPDPDLDHNPSASHPPQAPWGMHVETCSSVCAAPCTTSRCASQASLRPHCMLPTLTILTLTLTLTHHRPHSDPNACFQRLQLSRGTVTPNPNPNPGHSTPAPVKTVLGGGLTLTLTLTVALYLILTLFLP